MVNIWSPRSSPEESGRRRRVRRGQSDGICRWESDQRRKVFLEEFARGHKTKEDNARVYLRILNRDTEIPRIWVEERPRILRTVTAWSSGLELCKEDQELLDSLTPEKSKQEVRSESATIKRKTLSQSLQPWQFPYEEIRVARDNGNARGYTSGMQI